MARKTMKHSPRGSSRSPSQANPDVSLFDLLKKDHKKVKGLFEQIRGDGEMEMAERENLFSQIEEELQMHMAGEEKFFYPALKKSEDALETVLEAYEEHHVAKTVLEEISDLDKEDEPTAHPGILNGWGECEWLCGQKRSDKRIGRGKDFLPQHFLY